MLCKFNLSYCFRLCLLSFSAAYWRRRIGFGIGRMMRETAESEIEWSGHCETTYDVVLIYNKYRKLSPVTLKFYQIHKYAEGTFIKSIYSTYFCIPFYLNKNIWPHLHSGQIILSLNTYFLCIINFDILLF